jgi:glycine betaine/proline transport system ATP-binding protein
VDMLKREILKFSQAIESNHLLRRMKWIMPNYQQKIIEVKNLIKIYGDNPRKALPLVEEGFNRKEIKKRTGQFICLHNISFEVYEGEIFVIMGLSGSGKSTLLRCFNLLIPPTSGSIFIEGVNITKLKKKAIRELRRLQISMVFQNFALFPHRTLLENVEYGLEINHIPKDSRRQIALATLEKVQLKNWIHAYPYQISGGMQQRVGLARSLVLNPKIILMDEPFSALDPMIKEDMQNELIELQKNMNNTIIFISHDLNEALKIAHRILILKEGRIMQCGTPEEILSKPSNEYVEKFIGNANLAKILSASSLMQKPRAVEYINQGPRITLYKMDQFGLSKMFVIENDKRKLLGYVTANDVAMAIKRNEKNLKNILRTDFVSVDVNAPISDLIVKSLTAPLALAVLNETQELRGVITRSHIIAGLGRKEVFE